MAVLHDLQLKHPCRSLGSGFSNSWLNSEFFLCLAVMGGLRQPLRHPTTSSPRLTLRAAVLGVDRLASIAAWPPLGGLALGWASNKILEADTEFRSLRAHLTEKL
jgi:hypothetical protein